MINTFLISILFSIDFYCNLDVLMTTLQSSDHSSYKLSSD